MPFYRRASPDEDERTLAQGLMQVQGVSARRADAVKLRVDRRLGSR
jgi:hypothetical protein